MSGDITMVDVTELSYYHRLNYFQRLQKMSEDLRREVLGNNLFKPKENINVQAFTQSK